MTGHIVDIIFIIRLDYSYWYFKSVKIVITKVINVKSSFKLIIFSISKN